MCHNTEVMAKEDQCAAHLLVQVRSFRVPFFYNFAEAVNVGDYDGVKSDENWRKNCFFSLYVS